MELEKIISELPDKSVREKILDFEDKLSQHPNHIEGDSALCPLLHKFSDGIYVREIYIPAGTLLTGKIHRHDHPNFLMSGEVLVFTEDGGEEHLIAPVSMISKAKTKRVVYAITNVSWITVHSNPTNTQDLDELESIVIAKSYEELKT